MAQEQDATAPAYKRKEVVKKERAALVAAARDAWCTWARSSSSAYHEVCVLPATKPALMLFHPFEPVLLGTGAADTVTVYDTAQAEPLCVFGGAASAPQGGCLPAAADTRVSAMLFTNEHDDLHLVTGSSDGLVRVWRDFTGRAQPRMVTAWRALPQLLSVENGKGMLLDWQDGGRLLAAGDATSIRVWDVNTETPVQDIPTQNAFSVTALAFNQFAPSLFAVGFGDYTLSVFDQREPTRSACVASLRPPHPNLRNPIIKAAFVTENQLVSGAVEPVQVRLWDITKPAPTLAFADEGLEAFDVHRHAPLMASGSSHNRVRIYNFKGDVRHEIRYHSGLYSRRIASVLNIALHPYQLTVAAALSDNTTSIFSFGTPK